MSMDFLFSLFDFGLTFSSPIRKPVLRHIDRRSTVWIMALGKKIPIKGITFPFWIPFLIQTIIQGMSLSLQTADKQPT